MFKSDSYWIPVKGSTGLHYFLLSANPFQSSIFSNRALAASHGAASCGVMD
jgi:hypothetical protein